MFTTAGIVNLVWDAVVKVSSYLCFWCIIHLQTKIKDVHISILFQNNTGYILYLR